MPSLFQKMQRRQKEVRENEQRIQQQQNAVDRDLPFRLHIGGKIELSPLSFRAADKLHVEVPGGPLIIDAVGKGNILGNKYFRVLLHEEQNSNAKSYLFLVKDGGSYTARWFRNLDEVFPVSEEEWLVWFNDTNGIVGNSQFGLKDGTVLNRVWVKGDERIDPLTHDEVVYSERYNPGVNKRIKYKSMLYGRTITGRTQFDELLLVSIVESHEGTYVTIDVGVDIDPVADLTVRY